MERKDIKRKDSTKSGEFSDLSYLVKRFKKTLADLKKREEEWEQMDKENGRLYVQRTF
jgi:hypothetical protein